MGARVETVDGIPVAGWILRPDVAGFDVEPMLAEFGQVFRYPIERSDRTELMAAGQPCFLRGFLLARSHRLDSSWVRPGRI